MGKASRIVLRSRLDAAGFFQRNPRRLPRRIRPCDSKPRPTFSAGFQLLNSNCSSTLTIGYHRRRRMESDRP